MTDPFPRPEPDEMTAAEAAELFRRLCNNCEQGLRFAQALNADSFTLCPACVAVVAPYHVCDQEHEQ